MAVLNVSGRRVTVDDSFLKLSPDEQNATVDEIAASFGGATPKPEIPADQPRLNAFNQGVSQGLTANFGDEIFAGALTPIEMGIAAWKGEDSGKGLGQRASEAYDRALQRERAQLKVAEAESPGSTIAGNVVGGALTGGALSKGGVTLLNAAKPTMISMIGRGAVEGAAYGGLYGAGAGEGAGDRLDKALMGASIGGLTGGAMGAVAARGASKAAGQSVPSTAELNAAKTAAYDAADSAGVVYSPQMFQRVSSGVKQDLAQLGYDPALQPRIGAVINRLDEAGANNVTLPGAEVVRRVASGAYEPGNKSSNMMMRRIVDAIDNATSAPQAGEVLMGNAQQGTEALGQARDLASRAFKSDAVETAVTKATNRAASSNSGHNEANAIRQELRKLLERGRGFSPEERKALEQVVKGTTGQNLLRWAGNLLPSSGLGGLISGGAGYAALGPLGVAVPAVGYAAKRGADAMTRSGVERLTQIIRNGGTAPALKALPAAQRALIEAVLQGGAQQGHRVAPIGTFQ